ncbi:MAG: hypothetical protein ACRCX2_36375 [Paraclostridium sp.]
MNVRLDEFLVVSRASHIFRTMSKEKTEYLTSTGERGYVSELDLIIPTSKHGVGHMAQDKTIYDMTRNFVFILESLIEGLEVKKYVLCRPDKTMEYVLVANFLHRRKDNNETVEVQLPFMFTQTDIVAISPFNAPDLVERFGLTNQYIIGAIPTADLYNLDGTNKMMLLEYLELKNVNDTKNAEVILNKIDAIATSTHMQNEKFLKELSVVQSNSFNVITEESKEFEHLYSKYSSDMKTDIDDIIKPTDFMPIIVNEGGANKAMITKVVATESKIINYLVGIESFSEVNELTNSVVKEVLVRCPEEIVPIAIKLPSDMFYVAYNTIIQEEDSLKRIALLEPNCPYIDEKYIPLDNVEIETFGIEAEKMRQIASSINEKLLVPFKKFGIVHGTRMYELIKPVTKLPVGMAKAMLGTAFGIFKSSSQLEKEESEKIQEEVLNDELDSSFTKMELILQKYALLIGMTVLFANFFVGLMFWFICKSKVEKIRVKSIERVERRLVSMIGQYDKKIEFATQESDYESVKKLTHIRDNYKAGLDKLREVKTDALGKPEKYTDTYSEYNRD